MIDLDDNNLIKQYDKSDQLKIMNEWSSMIKEARKQAMKLEIPQYINWKDKKITYKKPSNIVICGMGGSAIAGDYVISLFKKELNIPIIVNREYALPKFVNESTLVICISYSGNTEEILSCFLDALQMNAMIISISSSGALESFSQEIENPHIKIREGLPPRCSLPLIYVALITILEKLGIILNPDKAIKETEEILKKLALEYSPEVAIDSNIPKKIAYGLFNTLPIFIGHTIYSTVAYRAKSEFNENSKIIAFYEEIPEQNHNGIVIFDNPNKALNDVAFIFFRDKDEPKAIKIRLEEVKKLAADRTENILEIFPQGESSLAKQLSTTYLIDFVSIYLAILYEVDPSITPSIDNLKSVLKKNLNLVDKIKKQIL
jgi:glucose/mannose-6-phosphate isomerase